MFENVEVCGSALEEKLKKWSVGPGPSEQQMCENAESVIRNALNSDSELAKMDTTVFTKGSFKNRTNISKQSDVDVCIRLNSVFFGDYPDGLTAKDFGFMPGEINYAEFKSLVHKAIKNYITGGTIEVGDKSIKIRSNSYRVNADIVPVFKTKLWYDRSDSFGEYKIRAEGIGIYSEKEQVRIYNWPIQDYENGISKNDSTQRMYKRTVRILKNLQCEMKNDKYITDIIASFLIESLVWNVPSGSFIKGDFNRTVRLVLAFIYNNLLSSKFEYKNWVEVNGIKYLFHESQPWTREQALLLVDKAWNYLAFDE